MFKIKLFKIYLEQNLEQAENLDFSRIFKGFRKDSDKMTAKQYLKKAKRIDAFIKAKNEELEELRAKSTSIGAVQLIPDKVQTSHSASDKLANDVVNIIECEERIKKAIQDYILLKDEINDKIEEIECDDFRLILQLRYLNQKDWETIAIEMNFSYSHTLSLHKQALDAFEEKHHDFLCS